MMTKHREAGLLIAVVSEHLQFRKSVALLFLALMLSLSCGCTTHSYKQDDGAMITVKKFLGIPYLEKEERSIVRPPGSEYRPVY